MKQQQSIAVCILLFYIFLVYSGIFFSYQTNPHNNYNITNDRSDIPISSKINDLNIIVNENWGGYNSEQGRAIKISGDYVFIAGFSSSFGNGMRDVCLIKWSLDGNLLWNKTFGGPYNDEGIDLWCNGSYVYVIGNYKDNVSANSTLLLLKWDVNGDLVWNRTWGHFGDWSFGDAIWCDEEYIYTLGKTRKSWSNNFNVVLIKWDNSGNELWNRTWGGNESDIGFSIWGNESGIYATGKTCSLGDINGDVFLTKWDFDGNEIWNRTKGWFHEDNGYSVWGSTSDLYTLGSYSKGGETDKNITKWDNDGNEIWTRSINVSSSVVWGNNSCFYVCAANQIFSYDNNAKFLWNLELNQTFDIFGFYSDGNYLYLTGDCEINGGHDIFYIKAEIMPLISLQSEPENNYASDTLIGVFFIIITTIGIFIYYSRNSNRNLKNEAPFPPSSMPYTNTSIKVTPQKFNEAAPNDLEIVSKLQLLYDRIKSAKKIMSAADVLLVLDQMNILIKELKHGSRRKAWENKAARVHQRIQEERILPILQDLHPKYERLKIAEIAEICKEEPAFVENYLQVLISKGVLNASLFNSTRELVFFKPQTAEKPVSIDPNYPTETQLNGDNLNGVNLTVDSIRYRLIKPIGKGGMGVIYLAENLSTHKKIVVKQLLPNRYSKDEYGASSCQEYWIREQRLIQIQSESPKPSMQLLGAIKFEQPEAYFLLLEYINAPPLDIWLQDKDKDLDVITICRFIQSIVIPIAEHLVYVHSCGIVHRDITPRNILIIDRKDKITPILIDWGVAKELTFDELQPPKRPYITATRNLTTRIQSVGNPPEVIVGCSPILASDIYMLGAIMYFLFTGQFPIAPATNSEYVLHPSQENDLIPAGLNSLVEAMTQYEPVDRIQTMEEVLIRLKVILQNMQTRSEAVSQPETQETYVKAAGETYIEKKNGLKE